MTKNDPPKCDHQGAEYKEEGDYTFILKATCPKCGAELVKTKTNFKTNKGNEND